jgi:hypothetical protein
MDGVVPVNSCGPGRLTLLLRIAGRVLVPGRRASSP